LTKFFSAIRNPRTKQGCERDLGRFFEYLKIKEELKAKAREFTQKAKSNPAWATASPISSWEKNVSKR
jgi:hypothetical protein